VLPNPGPMAPVAPGNWPEVLLLNLGEPLCYRRLKPHRFLLDRSASCR
jgi:hypothetical protein